MLNHNSAGLSQSITLTTVAEQGRWGWELDKLVLLSNQEVTEQWAHYTNSFWSLLEKLDINHWRWFHMVGFVNLLSSRQKASQKQCPRGGESRMRLKEGQAPPEGWLISLKWARRLQMHQADSSDGLGWPEASESPNLGFYALGLSAEVERKFHLLIVFEYYTWIPHWPQETNGLLLSIPSTSSKSRPCPGSVRQHQGARPVTSSEVCFWAPPLGVVSRSLTF